MDNVEKIKSLNFPLVSYLWLVLSSYFFLNLLLNGMIFWGVCFYTAIFSGSIYFFFARYSCKITIEKNKIIVQYLAFWLKNIEVERDKIYFFDYKRGFYDFGEDLVHKKEIFLETICYDTVYLKMKDGKEISINVNIRINSFKKLKQIFNTITEENQKLKSK
jgi:hypothetical protein